MIRPEVLSPRNDAAAAWGLGLYRSVLYAFTEALAADGPLPDGDPCPIVRQVLPTDPGLPGWPCSR